MYILIIVVYYVFDNRLVCEREAMDTIILKQIHDDYLRLLSLFLNCVDAPNVETIAVPVLSANVGLFGALTLTAIVAAVIIGVCVGRNKRTKGRKFLNTWHACTASDQE